MDTGAQGGRDESSATGLRKRTRPKVALFTHKTLERLRPTRRLRSNTTTRETFVNAHISRYWPPRGADPEEARSQIPKVGRPHLASFLPHLLESSARASEFAKERHTPPRSPRARDVARKSQRGSPTFAAGESGTDTTETLDRSRRSAHRRVHRPTPTSLCGYISVAMRATRFRTKRKGYLGRLFPILAQSEDLYRSLVVRVFAKRSSVFLQNCATWTALDID